MHWLEVNLRLFAKAPDYETKATLISQLILDDGVQQFAINSGQDPVLKRGEGVWPGLDFCLPINDMARCAYRNFR